MEHSGVLPSREENSRKITFRCSDPKLEAGFLWAKEQALFYAHGQGPAGPWYEAALPGRDAFCMRDVSHQAAGAHFLGLDAHNKNMLRRFAQSMSASRDYCCFWEITRQGLPAPEDYRDDQDFWYDLPANFDLLDACWRMYCLTGDEDYLTDPDLLNFYDRTITDYIAAWDHDGDGIPDRAVEGSHRGIPSYDEQKGMERVHTASDLIAAQYRGFLSYAELRRLTGAGGAEWHQKAEQLAQCLADRWYDRRTHRFYGAMGPDGTMFSTLGSPHLLAYFDAVPDREQLAALLDQIHALGRAEAIVELLSHYPEIFFRHNQPERGLFWLGQLTDPGLPRRAYPEVSFAVVGAYVTGLMGVSCDARTRTLRTSGRSIPGLDRASLENCPLLGGYIDLLCENGRITLQNRTGGPLLWMGKQVADGEMAEMS